MSFWSRLAAWLVPGADIPPLGPADDYWYQPLMGSAIDGATAEKLSTVWRCDQIICGTVAWLPLNVYRRLPNGGKEIARTHPMQTTLHLQANWWQTAYEFREQLQHSVLFTGNAYALIQPAPGSGFRPDGTFRPFDLAPLDPARMRVTQTPDGAVHYFYRRDSGREVEIADADLFHLRGPSRNGITGIGVLDLAAEAFRRGLSQEQFAGEFFSQAPQPGGVLKSATKLSDQAKKTLSEGWKTATTGRRRYSTPVLEYGIEYQPFEIGLTAEQAQLIEAREFTVTDVARWFGVPNHLVGAEVASSWGTGIEQMSIGFVQYTLIHHLKRWEQAISRDLLTAPETFFGEFTVDGLQRGDFKSRVDAYSKALTDGWMTPNEVRTLENLNPMPGADTLRTPAAPGGGSGSGSEEDEDADGGGDDANAAEHAARGNRNGRYSHAIPAG